MSGETPNERREAAATRRRWVTLAEIVALAGVVIAALTLWNSWQERRAQEAEHTEAVASATQAHGRVQFRGTVSDGGRRLVLADPAHDVTDLTIAFPTSLGLSAQTPADNAIGVDMFSEPLTEAVGDAHQGRLPVLVTARFLDGDATRTTSGIYDIVWRTDARLLRGRVARIIGFRLRERGGSVARVDALWKPAHQ